MTEQNKSVKAAIVHTCHHIL